MTKGAYEVDINIEDVSAGFDKLKIIIFDEHGQRIELLGLQEQDTVELISHLLALQSLKTASLLPRDIDPAIRQNLITAFNMALMRDIQKRSTTISLTLVERIRDAYKIKISDLGEKYEKQYNKLKGDVEE